MNLLALALGLGIERFLTHLFHLREPRWLDRYFDRGVAVIHRQRGSGALLMTLLVILVPVVPVILVAWQFQGLLWNLPYLAFAVVTLMFSLGPRDLSEEVDDYVEALSSNDTQSAQRVAKEMMETEPPADPLDRNAAVEQAIFVQASNRVFGVVLWFMVGGPTAAWLFRVTDLLRRRARYEAGRQVSRDAPIPGYLRAVYRVHGLMAWLPSRLVALGYALAGSFETAVSDWRGYYRDCAEHFFQVNEDIVGRAGCGALGMDPATAEDATAAAVESARAAMRLVERTLLIWLTVIALLTLAGLTV